MLRHPVTMIGMTSMRADRTNDFLKHTMHVDITCRMANILEEIRHENDDQSSSSKRSCARLRLPKPQQKVYAAYEIQHTIEFVANNREDAHGDALQRAWLPQQLPYFVPTGQDHRPEQVQGLGGLLLGNQAELKSQCSPNVVSCADAQRGRDHHAVRAAQRTTTLAPWTRRRKQNLVSHVGVGRQRTLWELLTCVAVRGLLSTVSTVVGGRLRHGTEPPTAKQPCRWLSARWPVFPRSCQSE